MVTCRYEIKLRERGSGIRRRRKGDDYRSGHSEIVSAECRHPELRSYNDCYRASNSRIAARGDPGSQG